MQEQPIELRSRRLDPWGAVWRPLWSAFVRGRSARPTRLPDQRAARADAAREAAFETYLRTTGGWRRF